MRRLTGLFLLILLAACSRPLAEGERAFARDLFGETLDVDRVRVAVGLGLTPAPAPRPLPADPEPVARRPGLCDRVAPDTGPREPPPAFALYDRVHVMPEYYHADMMPRWPEGVLVPEALIFGHELVHVWQWQNRRVTGYHPGRAIFESLILGDPYFYRPNAGEGFLGYGYEQQGALVEDYMCYLIFDPDNPRRAEIRDILRQVFTVENVDAALGR
ncbi:hypothetical protein P1J78_17795 [Psychromarinibacter sp. C21-152]|uniref:DUF4157 domain-containing protein n=1 Tax=Psychromarinibacter sediminicola TaxID=3033385 RepID=A0AAE3NX65_9RHOB|nr:hypothetical protein [Psychromarinibacter sediminicola]MDF0602595.1 hypothetical protein [Psychromarinibacter sediminicola]